MNVTGKQHPQFIERPASLFPPTSLKSGIALLYNEETTNSYDVCLKLTNEVLTIQKLDVVCTGGSESQVNYRTVVLRRQETGCLGLSIKGGAEHNVPVVISKIFKAQMPPKMSPTVDQVGKLFVGDAVLQVNGINVEHCTHEQVVHLLRTAGDEVIITVRYLREVPSFLKLPLGSSSADNSGESSSLFDCGSHFNGSKRGTASSPPSPSANEPKYEKRWMDAVSLPLLMARVSRYKAGMDKLRSNTFEVLALNGSTTNILQFCNAAETTDWLQAISTKISDLTLENMKLVNKYSASDDQIVHMGWACESSDRRGASRRQSFKFLAMRGPYFHIFSSPPLSAADWGQAEISYNLCEVLFKVHKTKSYMCSNHGTTLCFTIDFDSGFTCSDRSSNIQLWRYKFSQLKGSSDDGKTRVKLLFKNAESKQIDMKELEFVNLTAVLHCIHAFIAAKVASVDPLFMCAHSLCGS
ncbi:gamma-2-syntrophin isoform X3 [Dunckerocampus dactyliophorus]|uniref:gamma-2-syntrophin isoform X3 n=1 Tax=Dunckerocampus dactyliophorus TaxID=161453 RepID=UPI00240567DD|nr:gamma-2-syntrophin isoform X3 [Dunckerocampus dactyliophorus]